VTRRSIMEYVQALRSRYSGASKEGKGKMLDEFTEVTGLHRKAAIRLLNRARSPGGSKRRGRPAMYKEVMQPLRSIWEACGPGVRREAAGHLPLPGEEICSRVPSPSGPLLIGRRISWAFWK
jgi:hypothetical protein